MSGESGDFISEEDESDETGISNSLYIFPMKYEMFSFNNYIIQAIKHIWGMLGHNGWSNRNIFVTKIVLEFM